MFQIKKIVQWNNKVRYAILFILISVSTFGLLYKLPVKLMAQDNDECLACHEDKALTTERNKKKVSLYVEKKKLAKSVHKNAKCVQCHVGFDPSNIPHTTSKEKVQCGGCHKEEQALYNECMHGTASHKGDALAPKCQNCHGSHDILPNKDRQSPVYPLNVPKLCGKCHREGAPVARQRNIPETNILSNYTESIHGEGLIKKGLTVSATCASCHSPHRILPHTNPKSTINRNNIAATCTKCHVGIEFVHKKIIKGELWKKESKVLPACIDCHQPHKVRKVFYEQNLSDVTCKKCHENPKIGKSTSGKDMYVKHADVQASVHTKIACTQCHTSVDPTAKTRSCEPLKDKKVVCSSCHEQMGKDYQSSIHGMLRERGDLEAPVCASCHGTHSIKSKKDQTSPTFALNIYRLCSQCHRDNTKAMASYKGNEHNIINNYTESIHGKGLLSSGLSVTAKCTDCHTAHKELPRQYPESSVNPANMPKTCGKCHVGVEEQFNMSVHSKYVTKTDKKLPVCNDCHSAHQIKRTTMEDFRQEMLNTCGKCHKTISKTYFDTYHGKASRLGNSRAAKCSDCHGSHNIKSIFDINSTLSRNNKLATCQKCHPYATKGFTKYLTHATHHDSAKYPLLFITFWGMTMLLLGTFSVSFLHTLLWLPRSIAMRKQLKKLHIHPTGDKNELLYQRFSVLNRMLHFTMIISFLSLATTGMALKFSYAKWAMILAGVFGGVENAGAIHRLAATALFGIFIIHVYDLIRKKRTEFTSWKDMLLGPNTMIPNLRDLRDAKASILWFLGKGPRPNYGRWTYWEKFDYFAVFWGIFIIGSTGLTLWFPELVTNILPGWMVNIATIVHSDEALLAAGFIFTIHFFNTHFRPEKFPMDTVIFSGQMTVEELKLERPAEYNALMESGELEKNLNTPFPPKLLRLLKIFGWCALTIGFTIVGLIIYALIYQQ